MLGFRLSVCGEPCEPGGLGANALGLDGPDSEVGPTVSVTVCRDAVCRPGPFAGADAETNATCSGRNNTHSHNILR